MERYGSDTDADEQEKPLLRQGHEDKVLRGERKMCPANYRANRTVQVAKPCLLTYVFFVSCFLFFKIFSTCTT